MTQEIVVRNGKGGRDRVTLLPESMLWLVTSMQEFKTIVEAYIQCRFGIISRQEAN